jgi:hypothetical protein
MKSGVELITEERQRQIDVEKWDYSHDADYSKNQLLHAAICYAYPDRGEDCIDQPPMAWPWDAMWWKPTPGDRVRELVKAGALIAAEIDRLQNVKS